MTDEVDLGIDGLSRCHEVGAGGFAVVYTAVEERFGRQVAVKVLHKLDAAGQRRFETELLSMGLLADHPNVVVPYSSGYTRLGFPYLIMEYLSGGSLGDHVTANGPVAWEQAVSWILPIADALGYSHSRHILHRDVKPHNILLSSSQATKLSDFGIAAVRNSTQSSTASPFTLAHSPPETFQGGADRRDERSDLYSLASSLFTVITGRTPFQSDDPNDSQLAHIVRIAEQPVPRIAGIPDSLNELLARALAKDPAGRPESATAFIAELQAAARPDPQPGRPVDDTEPAGDAPRAPGPGATGPHPPPPPSSPAVVTSPASPAPPAGSSDGPAIDLHGATTVHDPRRSRSEPDPMAGSTARRPAIARAVAVATAAALIVAGTLIWRQVGPSPAAEPPLGGQAEPATVSSPGTDLAGPKATIGSPLAGTDPLGSSSSGPVPGTVRPTTPSSSQTTDTTTKITDQVIESTGTTEKTVDPPTPAPCIVVPSIIGMTIPAGDATLRAASRYLVGIAEETPVAVPANQTLGLILSQNPPAGTRIMACVNTASNVSYAGFHPPTTSGPTSSTPSTSGP